jgi:ParB/RepB/Spo0J family partition protein
MPSVLSNQPLSEAEVERLVGVGKRVAIPNGAGDSDQVLEVEVASLRPNPYQSRHIFDADKLEQLAASMAANGLLEPIIIATEERSGERYIVAGERRVRAAAKLGWPTIKALYRGTHNALWFQTSALVENLSRDDLKLVEKVSGLTRLIEIFTPARHGRKMSQRELARLLGESEQNVGKYLKIARHPDLVGELEHLAEGGQDGSLTIYYHRAIRLEGKSRHHLITQLQPAEAEAIALDGDEQEVQPVPLLFNYDSDEFEEQEDYRDRTAPRMSHSLSQSRAVAVPVIQMGGQATNGQYRANGGGEMRRDATLVEITASLQGAREWLASSQPGQLDRVLLEDFVFEAHQLYELSLSLHRAALTYHRDELASEPDENLPLRPSLWYNAITVSRARLAFVYQNLGWAQNPRPRPYLSGRSFQTTWLCRRKTRPRSSSSSPFTRVTPAARRCRLLCSPPALRS